MAALPISRAVACRILLCWAKMPVIPDPTRRFICRTCQRETGHWPIANGQVKGSQMKLQREESSFQTFQVVQCKDCGSTTYCIDTKIHPGPMIGDSYVQKTDYYPPLPLRIRPNWLAKLPENYRSILNEVYSALDNSLFRLASAGTRTVIDCLIIDQIGDIGGFEEKVKELVSKGIIGGDERDILLPLIDAGSASMHRSFNPSEDLIKHMMDILEKILFKVCIEPKEKQALKEKAKALREKTPKRE